MPCRKAGAVGAHRLPVAMGGATRRVVVASRTLSPSTRLWRNAEIRKLLMRS